MILQQDTYFNKHVRRNGCYFLAILFLVGQIKKVSWTQAKIMSLYRESIEHGHVRSDCYVVHAQALFGMFGLRVKYTNRHERADLVVDPAMALEIQYWRCEDDGHFVAAKDGVVIYDSYGTSNAVRNGQLVSKRVFVLEM